jgi:hypothetical protein
MTLGKFWSTADGPQLTAHFPKFQNLFPLFLVIKFIITGINRGGNGVIPSRSAAADRDRLFKGGKGPAP